MTYKRTINKFNRGEVDERFLARDDVDRVVDTSSQMDNMLPIRLGPMQYRPGTQYLGATFAAERVKQVPFLAPNDGSVMLEFSQTSANPSVERMRIWDNGALVTATATADTITNGTFDTDLTGWTDADDAAGTSAWATGGYMALNGNGTTGYGRRYQTLTVTAATERTIVVVIHDGEVECLLGEGGADSGEIFSGVLEKGTHLLTCTPVGTALTITLRSKHAWVSKVDSVSYHAAGALTISGSFFKDTSTDALVLDTLQYAQSADVIFLTTDGYRLEGEAHPLLRVSRRGDKSWSLSIPQITDGPFGALNDTACTLTLSGTSGDVTVTASVPLFMDATWIGRSYRVEYGAADAYSIIIITARASTTSASARVVYHNGTYAATADWRPGLFSYYQPGPTAVALYEGRLWLAGDGRVWGSVSDAYTSFDELLTGDSKAISRTIGFGPVQQINWLSAGPDLLAGTPSAEIQIGSNDFGDIITASNCRLIPVTSIGSDSVMPERIDDLLYIVQRSGKRIIEVSKDGFRDLLLLHPELCNAGITRVALTRHPEPRLIAVLADGTMAWALLEKAEQVTGWAPVELADADVLDVAVLPNTDEDEVYVIVSRASVKYMERFAPFADAQGGTISKHYDGHIYKASAVGTSVTGLSHLEGKAVYGWADGKEYGPYTVSSGAITVPANSWTGVTVGRKHTALWTSNRLGQYIPASVLTDRKRITRMGLVLQNVALKTVEYGDGETWYPLPGFDIENLTAPSTNPVVLGSLGSSGGGTFENVQDVVRGDGYVYLLIGGTAAGLLYAIAGGTGGRTIEVYSLETGSAVLYWTVTYVDGSTQHMAWSRAGRYLAIVRDNLTGTTERGIQVYDFFEDPPVLTPDPEGVLDEEDVGSWSGDAFWSPTASKLLVGFLNPRLVTISSNPTVVAASDTYVLGTAPGDYYWHPSGRYFMGATSTRGFEVYKLNAQKPALLERLTDSPTGGNTSDTDWRPDGTVIAYAHSASPYIYFFTWDAGVSAKVADPADLPAGSAQGVAWSPDGRYCAVGHSTTPFITVYDWDSGAPVKLANPASLPTAQVGKPAWSPDGRYLACPHGSSRFVTIYDFDSGTPVKITDPVSLPTSGTQKAAWSPDGQYLALSHTVSPFLTVYDWTTGLPVKVTLPSLTGSSGVGAIAWSTDSRYLAYYNTSGAYVQTLDWATGTPVMETAPDNQPGGGNPVLLWQDATTLWAGDATGSGGRCFVKYSYASGAPLEQTSSRMMINVGSIPGAAWSPAKDYMAVAVSISTLYYDARMTVIEMQSSRPCRLNVDYTSTGTANGLAWSADGRYIAVTRTTTQKVRVFEWDEATETVTLLTLPTDPSPSPGFCRWSPTGAYLAVRLSSTPFIAIYDYADPNAPVLLADPATLPPDDLEAMEWSPNGRYLACGHLNAPRFTVYDMDTGVPVKLADPASTPSGTQGYTEIRWSADSRYLLLGGSQRGTGVYDLDSGTPVLVAAPTPAYDNVVNSGLAFSPIA